MKKPTNNDYVDNIKNANNKIYYYAKKILDENNIKSNQDSYRSYLVIGMHFLSNALKYVDYNKYDEFRDLSLNLVDMILKDAQIEIEKYH